VSRLYDLLHAYGDCSHAGDHVLRLVKSPGAELVKCRGHGGHGGVFVLEDEVILGEPFLGRFVTFDHGLGFLYKVVLVLSSCPCACVVSHGVLYGLVCVDRACGWVSGYAPGGGFVVWLRCVLSG